MKKTHTKTAPSAGGPTDAYFLNFEEAYKAAPLLVYLPGLDETGKDLISLQTTRLEKDFNVRSLVIPPDDLDDWDRLADATLALAKAEIEEMSEPLPVYLCAESFGGCLAIAILIKESHLFDKVILVNPASSFHRVPWLDAGSALVSLVPDWVYTLATNFSTVYFLAARDRISDDAHQALLNSTRSAPKQTLQRRLSLMRTFSFDENKLRRVDQPVLIIGGKKDRILPSVAEAHYLSKIFPNAQVVTLPDSGHACLVENDIDLIKIMQEHNFLTPLAISI